MLKKSPNNICKIQHGYINVLASRASIMTKNACLHHAKWIHNFSFHDAHLTFTAIKIQTRRARLYEMVGTQQLKMFVVFVTHSNISQLYCQWHGMFSSFKTHFVSSFVFLDPLGLMYYTNRNKFPDFYLKMGSFERSRLKVCFQEQFICHINEQTIGWKITKNFTYLYKRKMSSLFLIL